MTYHLIYLYYCVKMNKDENFWYGKLLLIVFLLLTGWWVFLMFSNFGDFSINNQLFAAVYCVFALSGSIFGFWMSKKWGGIKSIMGKSLILFSFGLLGQLFGQIMYSYYIYFLKIEVPYPSLGDFGYFSTPIFYSFALIYLAKACGVTYNLKKIKYQIMSLIAPAFLLLVGYNIFLRGYEFDWNQPIKIFLDFWYPLGGAFYIGLAVSILLLSKGILGGIMKPKVMLLIFALFTQFAADFYFLYVTYYGKYYPGGANDYAEMIAYFFMNIALIELYKVYLEIKKL